MKKLIALVLALAMVALCGLAFAEDLDNDSSKFTIEIDNGVDGQTYTAYKVFDVDLATATGNTTNTGFSYSVSSTSAFWDTLTSGVTADANGVYTNTTYGLKFTPKANATGTYIVEVTDSNGMNAAKAAALAAALSADTTKPTAAGSIASYSSTSKQIDVTASGKGYYFVTTSTGALCSLDTTNQDVIIKEKNSVPSLDKEVQENATTITVGSESSTANAYGSFASGSIGETMNFRLTINTGTNSNGSGNGVNKNYVITDTLPSQMSYTGNTWGTQDNAVTTGSNAGATFAITDEDSTVTWTLGTNFWVSYSGDVITITLDDEAVASVGQNKNIFLTYGAKIDEDAVIAGNGMENTATLTYGTYVTSDTAKVYTYALALLKHDSAGARLAGAVFQFPFTATQVHAGSGANDPTVYKVTSTTGSTNITTPESGVIVVIGLDKGTYSVTEVTPPTGYNAFTGTLNITVKETTAVLATDKNFTAQGGTATFTHGADDTITVSGNDTTYMIHADSIEGLENNKGTELPSTGGIGTTIFYIVGGLLVIGAAVILVARRKASN